MCAASAEIDVVAKRAGSRTDHNAGCDAATKDSRSDAARRGTDRRAVEICPRETPRQECCRNRAKRDKFDFLHVARASSGSFFKWRDPPLKKDGPPSMPTGRSEGEG
jgi:hypothetical protein